MRETAVHAAAAPTVAQRAQASPPEQLEAARAEEQSSDLVQADLLIEDVSIDGMCGVY